MKKIDQKIVGYAVVKADAAPPAAPASPQAAEPAAPSTPAPRAAAAMNESISRPEQLRGCTYKIKSPLLDHAMYVTINDIVMNEGTAQERYHPFEIFINSKNMDQFQWILALTRIASAVFRKGGDVTFMVDELRGVFDPRGGYFRPGGQYVNSVVAEIGNVLEHHLREIGMIEDPGMSDSQRALIEEKRAAYAAREAAAREAAAGAPAPAASGEGESFPASATLCGKCNTKAVIRLDNCMTCLHCGDSKCG